MKRLLLAGLVAAALPAAAAEDPIAVRQALMSSNGAAGAVAGAIMKDELAYSPPVGKAVIATWQATAVAVGDFFPEGTHDPARSEAAPKIWEDPAGFTAALTKFQQAAAKATEGSGRAGPADRAAFAALIMPVLDTCKACHETYRLEN